VTNILAFYYTDLIELRVLATLAWKTNVLSCPGCLINAGVEKNEQHLNID